MINIQPSNPTLFLRRCYINLRWSCLNLRSSSKYQILVFNKLQAAVLGKNWWCCQARGSKLVQALRLPWQNSLSFLLLNSLAGQRTATNWKWGWCSDVRSKEKHPEKLAMIRQKDGPIIVYIAPLFEFIVRLITSATKVRFGTEIKFSQNLMNCYWKYKRAAR